jgi:pimeloyl-ACP methyl ester carboxylesterase
VTHQQTATASDGTSIAWSRTGAGDPVVLVHGITESAATFEPVVALLAATHDVMALDLRGHGESGDARHVRPCGDGR